MNASALSRSGPLLLMALAASSSAHTQPFQGVEPEYKYVEPLVYDSETGAVNLKACDIPDMAVGRFLPGSNQRMGCLVQRVVDGSSTLLYRDSMALWNTGDSYSVSSGLACFTVLPGAGVSGLDLSATVSFGGLAIYVPNAASDGFQVQASLTSWWSVTKLWTIDLGGGQYEIHGYSPSQQICRRATYSTATGTLSGGNVYFPLSGLRGVASADFHPNPGRELVFWSSQGDLIVTNAAASAVLSTLETPSTSAGIRDVQVLPNAAGLDRLGYLKRTAMSAVEKTVVRNAAGQYGAYASGSGGVDALASADWDGDGDLDLLSINRALYDGNEVNYVHVWSDLASALSDQGGSHDSFTLVNGSTYPTSVVQCAAVGDADGDGDQDLFLAAGAIGAMHHVYSPVAASQRMEMETYQLGTFYPITESGPDDNVLTVEMNLENPPNLVPTSTQRLRVRLWARGAPNKDWDMGNKYEVLIPIGFSSGWDYNLKLKGDFSGVSGWDRNDYGVMCHLALVKVNSLGEVISEGPPSIYTYSKGWQGNAKVLGIALPQLFGGPVFQAGGDVPLGRPPGNPPEDPVPSNGGG